MKATDAGTEDVLPALRPSAAKRGRLHELGPLLATADT